MPNVMFSIAGLIPFLSSKVVMWIEASMSHLFDLSSHMNKASKKIGKIFGSANYPND